MSDIYKVKLVEIVDEGENRVSLYFDVPEGFQWDPSAHISLALEGYKNGNVIEKELVRKFSISTLMNENRIGLTTRVDSSDSLYKSKVKSLCVGDTCSIIESSCSLPIRRENKEIVLISMGVGMATMRPLIKAISENKKNIKSVTNICVNKSENVLYKNEVLCQDKCFVKNIYCKNRTNLKETIDKITSDSEEKIYYIVGSKKFLEDIILYLKDKNVKKEDIMIDKKSGAIDIIYAGIAYESMEVKPQSKKFMKIALPTLGCACNGNCTCK